MRVAVINGSPSGLAGATACSVRYLAQRFPQHQFETHEVAKKVRALERAPAQLDALVARLAEADVVLWAFPVYVMLVPAQLKRFIELLLQHPRRAGLAGKVTACLSTSAHHYDHTAHDYMRGICGDLGLRWGAGFPAGLQDLVDEAGRAALFAFGTELFGRAARGEPGLDRPPAPVVEGAPKGPLPLPPPREYRGPRRVVIVSDARPSDVRLRSMIELYRRGVDAEVDCLELEELDLKGGCLGCMHCTQDNACVYRDGYAAAFDERVRRADVVLYAGAVRDRFFSARMKTFLDRYFSNGHSPILGGKLMGFLVSGPLSQLSVLREVLEAHIEVSDCQRLGLVSDEGEDEETAAALVGLARATERWLAAPWRAPPTFRGYAAAKNFRDLVYSHRGFMLADHRYYVAHGLYDYPQRDWRQWLLNTVLLVLRRLPFFRGGLEKAVRRGRLLPLERALAASARARA